jgi:peroxiredoxin
MMRRHLFVGILLALFLALSPAISADQTVDEGPKINASAPRFALPDISGKMVDLSTLKGKIIVLNFWAFWCDTWKAEMPSLRELASKQDELGFKIVAISVDGTRLQEFLSHTHGDVPFAVLLDSDKKISTAYNIKHVPTVVILDKNGNVRYVARAYPGNQAVLTEIRKLETKISNVAQ